MNIRRGITRTVLLTDRYALKVPSLRPGMHGGLRGRLWAFARGWLANEAEYTWWNHGTPTHRQQLCPVLWSLIGLIQCYPRCTPLPVNPEGEYTGAHGPLPATDPFPGDDKPSNLGLYQGRIVWIDYDMSYNGCPHEHSGAFNRLAEDRP